MTTEEKKYIEVISFDMWEPEIEKIVMPSYGEAAIKNIPVIRKRKEKVTKSKKIVLSGPRFYELEKENSGGLRECDALYDIEIDDPYDDIKTINYSLRWTDDDNTPRKTDIPLTKRETIWKCKYFTFETPLFIKPLAWVTDELTIIKKSNNPVLLSWTAVQYPNQGTRRKLGVSGFVVDHNGMKITYSGGFAQIEFS